MSDPVTAAPGSEDAGLALSADEREVVKVLVAATKGICLQCWRPFADQADWDEFEDGDGGHLCWAEIEARPCEWGPMAGFPSPDKRRAAALLASDVLAARIARTPARAAGDDEGGDGRG